MNVLVLDGNENQAVASVRSLAKAGHTVTVGSESSWSKAGWSRYCRRTFVYPSPELSIPAFVSSVVAEMGLNPGTLVLPMTEKTTLPLSANREELLRNGGKVVLPPHPTVLQAFDKNYTTGLARDLGIRIPQTCLIVDVQQAAELAETFPLPAVLKPRSSQEARVTGVKTTGRPLYARTPAEFLHAYCQLSHRASSIIAQQFVEGIGAGYFALMHHGEMCAEFAHHRLRDVHPTGSGSSLRVSVAPDPELRAAGLKLLRALHWHGVAMVEFRLPNQGGPFFLEVNGRFWNSLPLAVNAGCDFPALLARMAETGKPVSGNGYEIGLRTRWLLGDFRHLIAVWRGAPREYPGQFPGRLHTLAQFLTPVPGTSHDNFTFNDPLPEVGDWLDLITRRVPRLLKKK